MCGWRCGADGGANWRSFQNNLPAVEVRDIRIQPQFDDLVIATHGRALWVMDDIRAVQQSACSIPTARWYRSRPRSIFGYRDDEGNYTDFEAQQRREFIERRRRGTTLYYWLRRKPRSADDRYLRSARCLWRTCGRTDVFTVRKASVLAESHDGKNELTTTSRSTDAL